MPDMQSELSKVINAWDAPAQDPEPTPPNTPEPKAYFTTTNNVCRATFEYIRDNPGKTRKEVSTALLEKGYKIASTTTLIGQMVKQYHVRETRGLLYATTDQYVPLKGSKAWAKLQASAQRKHVTLVSKSTGKVINPRPAPAPVAVPVAVPVEKEWTPDDVISKLNVHQALALFKALRNILVG